MINQYLDTKITKKAGADYDFHGQAQYGVLRLGVDQNSLKTAMISKPWFLSLYGLSVSDARKMIVDTQATGWAVMRPKEREFDILFNPKAVDGLTGGPGGKEFAVSRDGTTHFIEMGGKNKTTPVIMAVFSRAYKESTSFALGRKQITDSTPVVPGPVAQPGTPQTPLTGNIPGTNLPYYNSSMVDIQTDGTKKPTTSAGVSPSGQNIRAGSPLIDPSTVKSMGLGIFPNDVNTMLGLFK